MDTSKNSTIDTSQLNAPSSPIGAILFCVALLSGAGYFTFKWWKGSSQRHQYSNPSANPYSNPPVRVETS